MSDIVSNALKEKKELQKRLAEIEQFLRLYGEFSGKSGGQTTAVNSADKPTSVEDVPILKTSRRGPKAIVRISTTILQYLGHPLTRGELAAELEERGVRLLGKDKESRARYVGTILWRNKDIFENFPGKGYWLVGIPVPENESERKKLRETRDLVPFPIEA
jgi:hypothetical protein